MPLQLAPGDRKILLIAAGIFVLMIAVAVLMTRGSTSDKDIPSTYSTASGGCKAAFLWLRESGYQVQTWEQSLRELSDAPGKTLILVQPTSFPSEEEKQKLAQFLKDGGRLIAAGQFANFYLPLDSVVPDPLRETTWKRIPALALSPITRAAPEITSAPRAYWQPGSGAVGIYGEADKPVVVEYTYGRGKVLWLADSTPLTNAGLKEAGNLEFLLAAVGSPENNQIIWDEYIHGYQHSGAATMSDRLIGWIEFQLALLAIAILLAYSRRSGPIWVPQHEVRLSPLEFVSTLGSLYENANAGGVAVDISYRRFRYLLTRRLGLSVSASVHDLDHAVRERGMLSDDDFANTLQECESSRYDSAVPASRALRLVRAVYDYGQRLNLARSPQGEKKTWKP